MSTEEFIEQYRDGDVAESALRVRQFPEVDAAFALQQIEGYQRARTKLPSLSSMDGWWWPARVSVEQCSSEQTAQYKQHLCNTCGTPVEHLCNSCVRIGADLTGGLGVDTLYLSEGFDEWHYVEMQTPLAELAAHNFEAAGRDNIVVHNTMAEEFLSDGKTFSLIYLDPARRDKNGGKVFRLGDCTPDVTVLYPTLMAKTECLMLKLSPMLDITEALSHIPDAQEVHIVAVHDEVKEVVVKATQQANGEERKGLRIVAVNIEKQGEQVFAYQADEERTAEVMLCEQIPEGIVYLYEPNSAILKAGAFKLAGQQYGLRKLGSNTHLYVSDKWEKDFPGRVFEAHVAEKEELKGLKQANVVCRNYPLKAEELKKKLKLKDGGEDYVVGCRIGSKPCIFVAKKI